MGLAASFRSIVLPREHGSWSLAFEPVLLALLAAPTPAGGALAGAVAAGFLARRPLKLVMAAPPGEARRAGALGWLAGLGCAAIGGLALAAWFGPASGLWPLLLAGPLGGLFLHFDRHNEMRAAEAEIAGSAAFALVPAAFAVLAGWSTAAALALAAVALVRSVPTVLVVRAYLRSQKGRPEGAAFSAFVSLAAVAVLAGLARADLVPGAAVGWGLILAARAIWLASAAQPRWPARRVGMMEAVLGLGYCATLGLA